MKGTKVDGKDPAVPLFARDWIAGTQVMPLDAQGAYMRLLCHQWLDGPLPDDPKQLARLLSVSGGAFKRLWPWLEPHFPAANGQRRNRRLERERAAREAYRAERAESGKKGAIKRWMAEPMAEPLTEPIAEPMAKSSPAFASAFAVQNDSSVVASRSAPAATHKRSHARTELPGLERRREESQGQQHIAAVVNRLPVIRVRKPA